MFKMILRVVNRLLIKLGFVLKPKSRPRIVSSEDIVYNSILNNDLEKLKSLMYEDKKKWTMSCNILLRTEAHNLDPEIVSYCVQYVSF